MIRAHPQACSCSAGGSSRDLVRARATASATANRRKQHQFQPGQSGNRKGRPKGAKNTATLLREILDRKIEVRSGSTVRKISVREAILTRIRGVCPQGRHEIGGLPVAALRHARKQPRSTRTTLRRRTNKKSSTRTCRTFLKNEGEKK